MCGECDGLPAPHDAASTFSFACFGQNLLFRWCCNDALNPLMYTSFAEVSLTIEARMGFTCILKTFFWTMHTFTLACIPEPFW